MDGVCHLTQKAVTSDPQGTDTTNTTYDGLGRVYTVANPFRTGDPTTGLTTYTYDTLGRTTSVAYPDGSTATTSYSGLSSTVIDAAGKERTLTDDNLGRLASVVEDPTGLDYTTSYTYYPTNDLDTVTQGSQTRTFVYDSLSRLTSAANPESGTTTYTYPTSNTSPCSGDPSSPCTRVDARGTTVTYRYEALDRVASKTYSDSTYPAYFYYDESSVTYGGNVYTLSNTKGRLSHTVAGNGYTDTAHSYDSLGRPTNYYQCNGLYSNCGAGAWDAVLNYDLAGDIKSYTTPYGITITHTINAAKHVTQVTSSVSDSTHPPTLAQNITYTAWGAMSGLKNGCAGTGCTQTTETWGYNNRLQPVQIEVGTSSNPSNLSCVVYNYYPSVQNPSRCATPSQGASGGNNGNVVGYYDLDNYETSNTHTATYAYDNVNRLTSAVATGNSTYNLTYSYTQDGSNGRFGNMTCQTNSNTQGLCPNLTFSATTNRITNSGFTYDANGNVTDDGVHTYQWDDEGHLMSVDSGSTATYNYDAFGKRVYGDVQGNDEYFYLYDPYGNPLAFTMADEWGADEFTLPIAGRMVASYMNGRSVMGFKHPNALGSWGLTTGYSGSVEQDQLYYPWGQEWTGISWFEPKYSALGWRDNETGLDWTAARFYTSNAGRWMTPDPGGAQVVKLQDPQTWNMYAYVGNNPTTLTDPTGLYMWASACADDDKECGQQRQRFRDSITNAKKALGDLDPKSREARELKKALHKLGEEGKGRISVGFGNAGSDKNGDLLGRTVGNGITINYDAVDKLASASRLSPEQATALDAGTTAHEATHPGPALFPLLMRTEHSAYFTESATYEGLHNTDVVFKLWNETWRGLTPAQMEGNREDAIQEALDE